MGQIFCDEPYFSGTDSSARMMVASEPTDLEDAIEDLEAAGEPKSRTTEIRSRNRAVQAETKKKPTTEAQQREKSKAVDSRVKELGQTLSGVESWEVCRSDATRGNGSPAHTRDRLSDDWNRFRKRNQSTIRAPMPWEVKRQQDDGGQGVGMAIIDLFTDFIPGVSNVKDATIALKGVNPVTNEKVGVFERILAGFFAIPVIGNVGKVVGKGAKAIGNGLAWIGKKIGKLGPLLKRAASYAVSKGRNAAEWTLEKATELWRGIADRLGLSGARGKSGRTTDGSKTTKTIHSPSSINKDYPDLSSDASGIRLVLSGSSGPRWFRSLIRTGPIDIGEAIKDKSKIPFTRGVYVFRRKSSGEVLYVGTAGKGSSTIRNRIKQAGYLSDPKNPPKKAHAGARKILEYRKDHPALELEFYDSYRVEIDGEVLTREIGDDRALEGSLIEHLDPILNDQPEHKRWLFDTLEND